MSENNVKYGLTGIPVVLIGHFFMSTEKQLLLKYLTITDSTI